MSRRRKTLIVRERVWPDDCSVLLVAASYTHAFRSMAGMSPAVQEKFYILKAAQPVAGQSVYIPNVGSVYTIDSDSVTAHLMENVRCLIHIYSAGHEGSANEIQVI